jgi:hypothetical protein
VCSDEGQLRGITRRRWQSNGAARKVRETTFSRALGTRPSPKADPRLGVVLYGDVEPLWRGRNERRRLDGLTGAGKRPITRFAAAT